MKVFIIGQSNVGKSYLFNQLCNKNIAITQNENNTTVDLISYKMGEVTLFDTPGIEEIPLSYPADLFLYKIRDSGIEEFDQLILKRIYESKIPVILVAKDLSRLPSIEKYTSEDIVALQKRLNLGSHTKIKPSVAIIGRENSGKSTLMNALLGYERCKVSEIPGTTKDSILEESTDFYFIDTAGYCKEKSYMQKLIAEKRRAILKESDGVVLLLDISKPITKMEKQLIKECKTYSNFCIVALNKKDIINLEAQIAFDHFHFDNFPIIKISAKNNEIKQLVPLLKKVYFNSKKQISTPKINSWIQTSNLKFFDEKNNLIKIKYLIQSGNNPIRFKYFASKRLSEKYEKFLVKSICKTFNLQGANLGISFKSS